MYKFKEDKTLEMLTKYIDDTYNQHYSNGKIQATEVIFDAGHGEGFCIGNILKYAQRYGKKDGRNTADLLKIAHYVIILLGDKREKFNEYTERYENGNQK
tara:strand:- start:4136 stop:4435 length:300 start_codon:yes stop_codon:yes gene_type:complete